MVISQSIIIQNLLVFLGVSAIGLFIAARKFRLHNKALALFTSFVLLIAGFYLLNTPFFPKNWFPVDGLLRYSDSVFFTIEPGATLISFLVLLIGFIVTVFNAGYLKYEHRQHTFYPLFLYLIIGILGMIWASDLLMVYLFSELMNISAYVLVAFRRKNKTAIEAGFKYLIMSSVASVIVLAGICIFIYTDKTTLISSISIDDNWLSLLAAIFILSGFSLKSALVPLHTWLPDAHGKAPSSISAVLSGVMVQSVFYTMVRTSLAIGMDPGLLGFILLVLATLNIIVGNLMGILQPGLKRMLGYSTIAQMGYIVMCFSIGLRNGSALAIQSGFFIIIAHALAKSLAFLSAGIFYYQNSVNLVKDIREVKKHPYFTYIVFSAAVFSLSAIPPFPGFTGKWTALTSVFAAGDPFVVWIALTFLLGSLLAFGYYLPLLVNLSNRFVGRGNKSENSDPSEALSIWMKVPAAFLLLSIMGLIIFPQVIIDYTFQAAHYLLGLVK